MHDGILRIYQKGPSGFFYSVMLCRIELCGKVRNMTIKMAYKVIASYPLYMPSCFWGTFTEYPEINTEGACAFHTRPSSILWCLVFYFPMIILLMSFSLLSASMGVRLLTSKFLISSRICSNTGSSNWKKLNCMPSLCSPTFTNGLLMLPF